MAGAEWLTIVAVVDVLDKRVNGGGVDYKVKVEVGEETC